MVREQFLRPSCATRSTHVLANGPLLTNHRVAEAQVATELTTEGKQRVADRLRRMVYRHVEATDADTKCPGAP